MRIPAVWKRRYPPARYDTNPRQHRLTRPVNLPLLKLRIDGLGPPRRGGPFSTATIFLVSQPRPRDCELVMLPPSFLLVRSTSRPDPSHHAVPLCPLSILHARAFFFRACLHPLRVSIPVSARAFPVSTYHAVPREFSECVRVRVSI